jgi:predicted DNA-binding transcriptional regulator
MGRWLSKEQQLQIEQRVLKAHAQGLTNEQILWRENIRRDRIDYILHKNKLSPNKEFSTRQADKKIDKALRKLEDDNFYVRQFP